MRIFIPTAGHLPRIKAPGVALATDMPVTIVIDGSKVDFAQYQTVRDAIYQQILAHDPSLICKVHHLSFALCPTPADLGPASISWMRDWVERAMTEPGEWYVFMDDNVSHVTRLPDPFYKEERLYFEDYPNVNFRQIFETPMQPSELRFELDAMAFELQKQDLSYGGFAIETNFYFRKLKWQRWGYVRTSLAVVQNDGTGWLAWPGLMQEDMVRSIRAVCKNGSVLINRYVKAHKTPFEDGGIGSFESRLPHLRRDTEAMMTQWPGLLNHVKDHDYQVTFAKRSQSTIDQWRRDHGYLVSDR